MLVSYRLTGQMEVPDGSKINDTGSGIILPDGKELKLWESLELCTLGEDDHRDIDSREQEQLGIFYDGDMCEFDELYDANAIAKMQDDDLQNAQEGLTGGNA